MAGPANEPWLSETISSAVQRHTPVLVEILNYKRDGTPFRNAVRVAPIFDAEGDLALPMPFASLLKPKKARQFPNCRAFDIDPMFLGSVAIIHVELDWAWRHFPTGDVFHLEFDIAFNLVLGEHVTLQQEVVISGQ